MFVYFSIILGIIIIVFIFLYFYQRIEIKKLADTFNKTIEDLKKAKEAIEESKTILKIRVRARARELKELAERREETIKERTKDLRERVEELERFYRLTIGRELKMIELKNEIKKLKEKLKRKNETKS